MMLPVCLSTTFQRYIALPFMVCILSRLLQFVKRCYLLRSRSIQVSYTGSPMAYSLAVAVCIRARFC